MVGLMRVAAWLFFSQGLVYFVIGALTPIMMDRFTDGRTLFFSARSDAGYFGDALDLREREPAVAKYRELLFLSVAGLLVALGIAVMAMAWFAVRGGQAWGYWGLAVAGLLAAAFWTAIIGKYVASGATVTVADIPPFMWVTTVLWAAGVAAGAAGLR